MTIAYPIGYPIAPDRVCPNRPRIAPIVSCQPIPYMAGLVFAESSTSVIHLTNCDARAGDE